MDGLRKTVFPFSLKTELLEHRIISEKKRNWEKNCNTYCFTSRFHTFQIRRHQRKARNDSHMIRTGHIIMIYLQYLAWCYNIMKNNIKEKKNKQKNKHGKQASSLSGQWNAREIAMKHIEYGEDSIYNLKWS